MPEAYTQQWQIRADNDDDGDDSALEDLHPYITERRRRYLSKFIDNYNNINVIIIIIMAVDST